jgi:hypothetical protein
MDKSANPHPPPTPKVTTASIAAAVYGDTGADPAPPSTARCLRSGSRRSKQATICIRPHRHDQTSIDAGFLMLHWIWRCGHTSRNIALDDCTNSSANQQPSSHTSLFLRSFYYNFVYEFDVLHYESNLIGLDWFDVGVSIQVCCRYSWCRFMPFQDLLISIIGLVRRCGSFPTFLLVVTICAIVVFPHNLPFLVIELNICKALTYSVHDPSEEVLLYSQVQGQVLDRCGWSTSCKSCGQCN